MGELGHFPEADHSGGLLLDLWEPRLGSGLLTASPRERSHRAGLRRTEPPRSPWGLSWRPGGPRAQQRLPAQDEAHLPGRSGRSRQPVKPEDPARGSLSPSSSRRAWVKLSGHTVQLPPPHESQALRPRAPESQGQSHHRSICHRPAKLGTDSLKGLLGSSTDTGAGDTGQVRPQALCALGHEDMCAARPHWQEDAFPRPPLPSTVHAGRTLVSQTRTGMGFT